MEVVRVSEELAPWLLLGLFATACLHRFVPSSLVRNSFRGSFGAVRAVLVGIPLPLCSCGVIPAAIGLKKQGASDAATTGFIISTPQTGVDSVMVSAAMLGWPFALFKVGAAIVLGITGGLLVGDNKSLADIDEPIANEEKRSWRAALEHSTTVLESIWRWLVIGILLSAMLTVWLPTTDLSELAQQHPTVLLFATLLVATPLYVCATASVPIAAALIAAGFPVGSALVFLMAGPATNTATVGTVYATFGKRTTAIYLATVVLGSLGFAAAAAWVIPTSASISHIHTTGWGSSIAAIFLAICFAGFFVRDLRKAQSAKSHRVAMSIRGMTCGGCVRKLERVLAELPSVESAVVRLDPGSVHVTGTMNVEALTKVIESCGWKASLPSPPSK